LLVSGVISAGGALLVLFGMAGAGDERVAAAWALVQFLSGVWAGVLGANSPFLHGLVAGRAVTGARPGDRQHAADTVRGPIVVPRAGGCVGGGGADALRATSAEMGTFSDS
jgi:hypothetical protein